MFAESNSPTVISDGSNSVLTVTSISPNERAGAWSPPKPCPNASGISAGIVKIPITVMNNASLLYNRKIMLNPYLKLA